jgi:hypothetical protein
VSNLTPGGALKSWIDAQALGVNVHVRHAPADEALPYITIIEGISAPVESRDDGGRAAGGGTLVAEELQVDLWMRELDMTAGADAGAVLEDYTLPYRLAAILDGAQLGTFGSPARRIYACLLSDGPSELPDATDPNLIRKVYTVTLHRET